MAHVHPVTALVVLELSAGFVDGVVGEVHVEVAKVLLLGNHVLFVQIHVHSVANRAKPSR